MSVLHAVFLILGTTAAAEMLTFRDILAALVAAYGALGVDVDTAVTLCCACALCCARARLPCAVPHSAR